MQSDSRVQQALTALDRPIAEFRALMEGALRQADAFLEQQMADEPARVKRASAALGVFGASHIDATRFAALHVGTRTADEPSLAALRRAVDVLRQMTERGDNLFLAEVTSGAKISAVVESALAMIGWAFGAIIVTDLVRGGRYVEADHASMLDPLQFGGWNRSERRAAPPLVVRVAGVSVRATDLASFADGHVKLVLVVSGDCAPAPLARLITPGTFVLQTTDASGLDRVALFDGPAFAALMPAGAATFVHDPALGRESWQRLTVSFIPDAPKKAVGAMSTWQQLEELKQLADLARTPFSVPNAGGNAAPAMGASDAADRIASWLLTQSGLGGTA
ncbi:MAG: hypothetical protein NTZ43_00830 [Gemmatimonadetes bacterium]|nr:hypothetical protein [Gemmatimonadota bacterium]